MTENHERIEELLAGYVLQSLSGDDAHEADRLLSEHVPGCEICRETLGGFQAVTGELALAAPAARPPDLLLSRLRNALQEKPVHRRRPLAMWVAAAAVVVVVGLAGWDVFLNTRFSDVADHRDKLTNMLTTMLLEDGSQLVTLKNADRKPTMLAAYEPGFPHMRLVGVNVPAPAPGNVYRVWVVTGGRYTNVAEFVPDEDGIVALVIAIDPEPYDQVVCTEERAGHDATQPGGSLRWAANV